MDPTNQQVTTQNPGGGAPTYPLPQQPYNEVSIQPAGLPRPDQTFTAASPTGGNVIPSVAPVAPPIEPTPVSLDNSPLPTPVVMGQAAAPAPIAQPQIAAPAPQPQQTVSASSAAPKAPPAPKTNPNSTQNTLQIAEIRDGIVIMNDGSFRSVVMVKSINFDLMSPQEQESVEYAYQGFLNSLYFPIQIFIRSTKVDLTPYIEKLDKIRTEHDNMLLALLMEDYIGYIDALAQQTNIMDKKFYVVVPYFPVVDVQKAITQTSNFFSGIAQLFSKKEAPHVVINEADLEKAKTELRNRVQAVLGGLQQAGIQGLPLDTQELIELYYDTYNPDTATRQQLKNFGDLTADVVTKGEGMATQTHLQREMQ